ncbi:uncharacterized protein LOC128720401 [Anopheles nili]|uniref:uncharacterized protein LOC128720401 n=1 Tax=Anopheles nili TaxID=185578 RepID=UPI00237B158E|nr:uncharacterized protein LOC128720401 [Anopheles nili]
MLSGRIRRRALALLGALLLVILVWPPCCASMPKPPPSAGPAMGPWDVVPHPAAAVLPLMPAQPGWVESSRPRHPAPIGGGQQRQQGHQDPPAESDSRKSRRVSEFYRILRALGPAPEPYERRWRGGSGDAVVGQLNLPPHERSSAVRNARDYLAEPIDKNKSQSARFDDTQSTQEVSRRKREVPAPFGNPHRHQHQLAGATVVGNGTNHGWHGRRGATRQGPLQKQKQLLLQQQQQQQQQRGNESNLERNERSANLSRISGATRKIQVFIKNRYVQLLPDGTVNGTNDDLSDYTILQRTTVGIGQIKIQAVATCLFLCMDTCGSVYGSKEFTNDCIFNEQMEQHHYNTYSSTHHSNARRTLYLALNKTGQPRKIQIPVNRTLGKLATYTKALTQTVAHDRVEQLISRLFGPDHVRHGLNQLCESGQPLVELTAKDMRPRPTCGSSRGPLAVGPAAGGGGAGGGGKKQVQQNTTGKDEKDGLRQKKKKKRRKCREDEVPGEQCFRPGAGVGGTNSGKRRAGQGGPARGGSSISSGSGSVSPSSSSSSSSVGSISTGTNQSASLSNTTFSSNSSNSSSSSSANSLVASISNGGPNRQGQPYAQLTATPNTRKPKSTKKPLPLPAGGTRKPKKPPQQQQQQQQLQQPAGKRTGPPGNQTRPLSAKAKLVGASLVTTKLSNPKPASLVVARTMRPTIRTTVPSTTPSTTAMTTTTTVSNELQDTSEDSELELDDLQSSSELVDDELDELDEVPGSPTASSWHELLPASSVSARRGRYRALSCCSFLSLSTLVVYGATAHLLYL